MEENFAEPQDFAERSLRYTKDRFEELLGQTEDYVRENPGRALAYAALAGLVIDRLPVFRIVGGLTRLALFAIKPAILIYGATKVYQAAQQQAEEL